MSGQRKPWDMTSTHALEGAAEWIRKRADASVVMVVRARDMAFAVAPGIRPQEIADAIAYVLPGAVEELERRRRDEQEAATRKRAAKIAGLE